MNIPRELELALYNDMGQIRRVEVTYANEETVSGLLARVKHPYVFIEIDEVPRGQYIPEHSIDFPRAKKIELTYHSGEVKSYP